MRVLVADDHAEFLSSLARTLLASDNVEIAGTATSVDQAVRLAADQKPDIAILDVRMPGTDGMGAIARVRTAAPDAAVIMLSLSYDRQYVRRALEAGAAGYVAKADVTEEIMEAVASIRRDEQFLSTSVVKELRASSIRLLSAEAWHELQDVIDREGTALLKFAQAVAPNEKSAIQALTRAFAAFAIARDFSEEIPSARVWLLVSLASEFFGSRPALEKIPGPEQPSSIPGNRTWSAGWPRCNAHSHANQRDFAGYWQGRMSSGARNSLTTHLAGCRSCHLQWSLVGYRELGSMGDPSRSLSQEPALSAVRTRLLSDIHLGRVEMFLIALAQRTARLEQLVASEIEVLLGSEAANGWATMERPPVTRGAPARWAEEFLGGRSKPFLAAGLRSVKGSL